MEDDYKSKSQRKREMTDLQDIGAKLVELSAAKLDRITLPENLVFAIQEIKRIKSHEGRRRQLQYIGRLMRGVDPAPIRAALAALDYQQQQTAAQFHLTEKWRDRLIAEGKSALTEFLSAYPHANSQHLRHLLRDAVKEHQQQGHVGAARALFRYLREIQQPHNQDD